MTEWGNKSCIFDDNDLIGQGAFSKVYRNTKLTSGSSESTAVKVYQKSKCNQNVIDHAKRQKNILKNIESEYICSYRQSLESKNKFYMIQKLEEGLTLDKFILRAKKIESKQVVRIAKAILNGLQYLHSKNIMHRDLKPANIMYNSDNEKAVLLDLGFATYFHKNDQKILTSFLGTPGYMSPQLLMGKKYNSLSDVWSFGVIVYQLLCGQLPFKGRSQKQILNSILSKDISFKSSYSPTLHWIVLNCLKIDTNQRLTWQDLFKWKDTGKLQSTNSKSAKLNSSKRKNFVPSSIMIEMKQKKEFCQCQIF